MRNRRQNVLSADEVEVLDEITVRLIIPEEQGRWDQLVSQHHYLASAIGVVGARVSYSSAGSSDRLG